LQQVLSGPDAVWVVVRFVRMHERFHLLLLTVGSCQDTAFRRIETDREWLRLQPPPAAPEGARSLPSLQHAWRRCPDTNLMTTEVC